MPKLSLSVISYNEEDNIGNMLESVKDLVDEIIIVDSFSTDKTKELAESYGAKVYLEQWKGHIAQKNSALEKCNGDWILMLDCDEVLTPELNEEIKSIFKNDTFGGYFIQRKTFYLGKLLKHSWQPDYKLRLVKKSSNPKWSGLDPHDSLTITGSTSKLKNHLIHYSYKSIRHHFDKTVSYAQSSAESYFHAGKKFSFLKFLFNPVISFLKLYIINLGLLDGYRGLIAGFSAFVYTSLKYIFLLEKKINNINQ